MAKNRIAGTVENVDLFVEDILNEDQHNFGEEYFVHNRNEYPMRITIKIVEGENIEDRLIRYSVIIPPHERVSLGSIFQGDPTKLSNWKYEWEARPDFLHHR